MNSWWPFGNQSGQPPSTSGAAQQQGQTLTGLGAVQQTYYQNALQNSLIFGSGSSITGRHGLVTILDIDGQEKRVTEQADKYSQYANQKELLAGLKPQTKEILRIVQTINSIEDYKKLDDYVRHTLFHKAVENIIDEELK